MTNKMTYKNIHQTLRPGTWVKSAIMVVFGVLLTRYLVGSGRVRANLTFGPIIFFLLALSGMFSVLVLGIVEKPEKKLRDAQIYLIIGGVSYLLAFGLSIYHSARYDLGIIPVLAVLLIGAFEDLIIFYGKKWKFRSLIPSLWNSFLPAFGFFYGALIGGVIIPIYVYLIFFAIFSLQLSKDIVKKYERYKSDKGTEDTEGEAEEEDVAFIDLIGSKNLQKGLVALLYFSMFCIVIPEFLSLPNTYLYLFGMALVLVLLEIAALLMYKVDLGVEYKKKFSILLKCGIFAQYLMVFLGCI